MTSKCIKIIILMLCAAAFLGCDRDDGPDDMSKIIQIEYSISFGMCANCDKTMRIDAEKVILTHIVLVHTVEEGAKYSEVVEEIPFSEKEWNDLISVVDLDAFNALPELIGDGDADDGGEETIIITTTEGEKKVTFDYDVTIRKIKRFLSRLRKLQTKMFSAQSLLDKNRDLWDSKAIDTYSFTVKRRCFCPQEEDIIVTVESGNIVSAAYTPSGEDVDETRLESLKTIDNLFDYIQTSIGQNAEKVDVSYDDVYGFPKSIYVDRDYNIADEEMSYTLYDFTMTNSK